MVFSIGEMILMDFDVDVEFKEKDCVDLNDDEDCY